MKNVVSRIELPDVAETEVARSGSLGERMDLVEHLAVKLDVSIGQATLPVDKLFALTAGEILALSAPVDGPVNVHLNGKLIARGELIAVDEQFGVRITEIAP